MLFVVLSQGIIYTVTQLLRFLTIENQKNGDYNIICGVCVCCMYLYVVLCNHEKTDYFCAHACAIYT